MDTFNSINHIGTAVGLYMVMQGVLNCLPQMIMELQNVNMNQKGIINIGPEMTL
jgi:hypothetical protein